MVELEKARFDVAAFLASAGVGRRTTRTIKIVSML